MGVEVPIGFYGKLPSLGDFISRAVDDNLLERWDAWLQSCLVASRSALGDRWVDLYMTAPMWRFHAQGGVLCAQPVAGLMFPSVDRVGRYFPLTVFATLPREAVGLVVADRCAQWFERVEDLVLAQLEDDSRDADQFEAALAETALLLSAAFDADASVPPGVVYPDVGTISTDCLHFALGDRVDPAPVALAWLDQLIARSVHAPVYWWTSGSEVIRPSWLVSRGLPEPAAFAAMLSGDWFDWPWQSQDNALPLLASGPAALHFESAGKTHPGKVRKENQDAFAARPECGLWVVADGMGGHAEGHIASQMVRDALAALEPQASLARSVEAVGAALSEVLNPPMKD